MKKPFDNFVFYLKRLWTVKSGGKLEMAVFCFIFVFMPHHVAEIYYFLTQREEKMANWIQIRGAA